MLRKLKAFFQRLGRKNKKPAKPVCVVVYAVDHVRHRFVYRNVEEAEKNYKNLANVVIYSAESCKIDEGIVTMFIDGVLHRQVSFTPLTGLQTVHITERA